MNGAAQATVIELHQTTLQFVVRTEPTAANQVTIESNGAEFIHHHCQALTALGQEMAKKCRFTGSEESGDDGDRKATH